MANMLNTRIRLKYDTYANWSTEAAKKVVLLEGEVALVAISAAPTLDVNSVSAPQVLMKVGDGKTEFQNLPWISAKAADVHSWAKLSWEEFVAEVEGIKVKEAEFADEAGNAAKLGGQEASYYAVAGDLSDLSDSLDDVQSRLSVFEDGPLVGQAVPREGFVEKVYVNTSLSAEEVIKILRKLNLSSQDSYVVLGDQDWVNYVDVATYSDWDGNLAGYTIGANIGSADNSKYYTYFNSKSGWYPDFTGEILININAIREHVYEPNPEYNKEFGYQNEKLTNLFSITPFEKTLNVHTKAEIDDLIYNLEENINKTNEELEKTNEKLEKVDEGLLTLETTLGINRPVDATPGTFIGDVYINTSLPAKDVVDILSPLVPNRYNVYAVCSTENEYNAINFNKNNNDVYTIFVNGNKIFEYKEGYFNGWIEDALTEDGRYSINDVCVWTPNGSEKNNLITSLVSLTPFGGGKFYSKEEVNDLLDEKQGQLTAGENISIDDNVISAADTWRPISFLNNGNSAASVADGEALFLGLTNIKASQTSGGSVNLDLTDTGVTAGTYNNVTVDAKGRVTAASSKSYAMSGDLSDLSDRVDGIVNGTTKVGNADKLDDHDSTYFATAESVTNIVNGTTKVSAATSADNADKLDNHDATYFATANALSDLSDRVDDVVAVAEGKTKTYVSEEDEFFLKAEDTLTFTYSASDSTISIGGVDVVAADLHIGDIVLVKELYFPDRWVSGIETKTGATYIYFSKLETTKVDLDPYQKKEIAAIDVNGTSVNTVSGALSAIDTYVDTIAGSLSDLSDVVDGKQEQLTPGDFITIDASNKISSSWRPVYVNSGSDFSLQSSQNNELRFDTSEGSVVMKQGTGAGNLKVGLSDTGVAAGTYNNVTVDAKGRVTAGSNESYAMSDDLADLSDRVEVIEEVVTVEDGLLTLGDGKDKAVEIASEEFAIKTGDSQVETFSTHHMSTTINSDAITLKTNTNDKTLLSINPTKINVGTSGLSTNINGNINLSADGGTLKIKDHTITATSTSLAVNGNALALSSEVGAVSGALSDLADGVDALTDRVDKLEDDLGERLDNIEDSYLPLAGGTMTGDINLNSFKLKGAYQGVARNIAHISSIDGLHLGEGAIGATIHSVSAPKWTNQQSITKTLATTDDIPTNVVRYYEEDEIDTEEPVFVFCCGSASKLV